MDKITAQRLTESATQLGKFLELHPDERDWLLPLLGKAEQRAIAVLDEISGYPLTFEEIAKLTDTHPSTVKQILQALRNGGLNFQVSETGKWLSPAGGRKRKLLKI